MTAYVEASLLLPSPSQSPLTNSSSLVTYYLLSPSTVTELSAGHRDTEGKDYISQTPLQLDAAWFWSMGQERKWYFKFLYCSLKEGDFPSSILLHGSETPWTVYSFTPKLQMRLKIQSLLNVVQLRTRRGINGKGKTQIKWFHRQPQAEHLSLKFEDYTLCSLKREIGQSNLTRHGVMKKI